MRKAWWHDCSKRLRLKQKKRTLLLHRNFLSLSIVFLHAFLANKKYLLWPHQLVFFVSTLRHFLPRPLVRPKQPLSGQPLGGARCAFRKELADNNFHYMYKEQLARVTFLPLIAMRFNLDSSFCSVKVTIWKDGYKGSK